MNYKKEFEKKRIINKTLKEMDKQIDSLDNAKQFYIDKARKSKESGLTQQYNLALNALKETINQQIRVKGMKLQFEIQLQMKDVSKMTVVFLNGMKVLSKDMYKTSKEADFKKIGKLYEKAMSAQVEQTQAIDTLLNETQDTFSSLVSLNPKDKRELDDLIGLSVEEEKAIQDEIDKELKEIKEKISK